MKKIFFCLLGCFLLALTTVRAQDTGKNGADSVITLGPDTTTQTPVHSTISRDTTRQAPDTAFRYRGDSAATATAAGTPATSPMSTSGTTTPASATSPATRSVGDSSTPITVSVITSPATTDSTPKGKTPDTLITLTDAPNPQSTVNNDTLTTKKTQGGNSIEIKTVGASIDTTTQQKTGAGVNNADQAKASQQAGDTASQQDKDQAQETSHKLDPRWFIGVKGQFQDFAFLEKNREGYLSNANTLPFSQRGNTSVALSAYKNLTGRLSASADLGLSFGHVTSKDVLISQTKKMTFNLLNVALYYHLLPAAYRLQPYVTVGFNDIINNGSYPCVPMGIGAKFNSRKVMVLGQVTYGQSVSHSIASTTMYSVGVYIPIKSKKYKNLDTLDTTPYNRMDAKKKDSTGKTTVINNIYVTINMDSILKAKGLLDDNGNPTAGNSRRGGRNDGDDDNADDAASRARRRKKPFKDLGLDDFSDDDYKIDSINGKPVIRFVVYFEFNEYGLNSKAFSSVDKVISHLKRSQNFSVVEIKGYTDSVGSDFYNNLLSRRRAKMILDYMNSRGVPTEIMKAQAYGRDNPVADNSDPNKAWLNRRAEIIIYRKSDLAAQ